MKNKKMDGIVSCVIGNMLFAIPQYISNFKEEKPKEFKNNIESVYNNIDISNISNIFITMSIMIGIVMILRGIYILSKEQGFETTEEDESLKTLIQNKENKKEIISKIRDLTKKEIQELIIKEKLNKKESDLLFSFYEEEYKNLLKEEKILKNKIREKESKMNIKSSEIKIY